MPGGIFHERGRDEMTLRHLEIFLALARTPRMREVGERHFISQAAVSSALRDFEAELGVPLFDRVGRGILLNDKGRLLAERLAPLYTQLNNALGLARSDALAGRLCIGASTTLADFVLPQILYDFKMRHSDVEIECESGNTADIVRHVESGKLDVGFVEGEVLQLSVTVTPLGRETLVVVSSDSSLACSGPHSVAGLMDRHWLLREPGSGTRETFLRQLSPRGLRPEVFFEFGHNDPIKLLLRNPDTLSCLSPRVVERELRAGELFVVPVADAVFVRSFYRVEHKSRAFSRLRQTLCEAVRKALRSGPQEDEGPLSEQGI